jgi:hypothetical protein
MTLPVSVGVCLRECSFATLQYVMEFVKRHIRMGPLQGLAAVGADLL